MVHQKFLPRGIKSTTFLVYSTPIRILCDVFFKLYTFYWRLNLYTSTIKVTNDLHSFNVQVVETCKLNECFSKIQRISGRSFSYIKNVICLCQSALDNLILICTNYVWLVGKNLELCETINLFREL